MRYILTVLVPLFLTSSCDLVASSEVSSSREDPLMAGGTTTIFDATSHAFSSPAPNLTTNRLARHFEGDAAFEQVFVTAPAVLNPGLGPIFNQTSCAGCHVRDGRSRESLLIRISVDGMDAHGGTAPVPGFGNQIQDRAVFGVQPEADVVVTYEEIAGAFADGTAYSLHKPIYRLENPYRPLPAHVQMSPRVARPVFGLGLLEAVSEATLLDLAATQAGRDDGISGRPNYVWDAQRQTMQVGRFGWKANQPGVLQQTAAAYLGDMGITSPLLPNENSLGQPGQVDSLADDPEINMDILETTAFYMQTLAVPAPRNPDVRVVRRGRALFTELACARCHVPQLRTDVLADIPEVSNQTIYPYTDLLLHDMGEDLADHRPDYDADGREWRTPPLWGIGLSETVTGHTHFLHDGRARTLMEAILWHGGEAATSRDRVLQLSATDRDALIAFLNSL